MALTASRRVLVVVDERGREVGREMGRKTGRQAWRMLRGAVLVLVTVSPPQQAEQLVTLGASGRNWTRVRRVRRVRHV